MVLQGEVYGGSVVVSTNLRKPYNISTVFKKNRFAEGIKGIYGRLNFRHAKCKYVMRPVHSITNPSRIDTEAIIYNTGWSSFKRSSQKLSLVKNIFSCE
jgi:hypothetical protein